MKNLSIYLSIPWLIKYQWKHELKHAAEWGHGTSSRIRFTVSPFWNRRDEGQFFQSWTYLNSYITALSVSQSMWHLRPWNSPIQPLKLLCILAHHVYKIHTLEVWLQAECVSVCVWTNAAKDNSVSVRQRKHVLPWLLCSLLFSSSFSSFQTVHTFMYLMHLSAIIFTRVLPEALSHQCTTHLSCSGKMQCLSSIVTSVLVPFDREEVRGLPTR